jgi:hypothetical protein
MQTSTQLISAWPYAKPRIVLREQLLSQTNLPPSPRDHAKAMQETSSPTSPSDQGNNDPTTGGSAVMSTSADSDGGGENGGDGRKGYGKRELSTSKRAAQNRAAQRAFRQRKEGYIKKLEEQVRDYEALNSNFKAIQAENYQLRDYIINLQSRLLESQGEFPPPPSNVDGLHPGKTEQIMHTKAIAPLAPRELTAINQLRASAEHVANDPGMMDRREDTMAVSGMSYNAGEPSRAKRARIGSHDMSAAQEALQGAPPRGPENSRAIGREEVIASR